MSKVAVYYKAVAGALVAGLTSAGTALVDGGISKQEWIGIALAVLATSGAVGVVTNAPDSNAVAEAEKKARAFHTALPDAVASGVVQGLAQLGHTQVVTTPAEVSEAATPDVVDPATATPEQILASVPPADAK